MMSKLPWFNVMLYLRFTFVLCLIKKSLSEPNDNDAIEDFLSSSGSSSECQDNLSLPSLYLLAKTLLNWNPTFRLNNGLMLTINHFEDIKNV